MTKTDSDKADLYIRYQSVVNQETQRDAWGSRSFDNDNCHGAKSRAPPNRLVHSLLKGPSVAFLNTFNRFVTHVTHDLGSTL
jgi:hypothetical protein